MSLEHIRLSEQARDSLVKLKRFTGIPHWSTLCRWAFCASLAEPSVPAPARIPADSAVEMSWKTFGGPYADVYLAILRERCRRDGLALTDETLTSQFRLHLHRGIGYLSADRKLRNIAALYHPAILDLPPTAS
jgi:DNA sulfur modification protein DndE